MINEIKDLNNNGLALGSYQTTDKNIVIWINKEEGGNRLSVEVKKEDLENLLLIKIEEEQNGTNL